MIHFIPMHSLQIFAEGGAGGAAGAAGAGDGGTGTAQGQGVTAEAASQQTKGVKGNPLANVKYGIQEEAAPAAEVQKTTEEVPEDLNAEFESLIKGKFKDQYSTRVQDTIRDRLKGKDTQITELTDKQTAMAPILELLGKKYGVDSTDIKALSNAIQDDDSYFEEEALQKGISVQQLKEIRKMERENAELRKQMQEKQTQENANKIMAGWMEQAETVKQVYPSFDLKAEMQNPQFIKLLRSNVDVRTAYEVMHKDDIIQSAMQFTANTVKSKIAQGIAAQGERPAENGMSSGSTAVVKSDVSKLNKKDLAEIQRRVARGERISFG